MKYLFKTRPTGGFAQIRSLDDRIRITADIDFSQFNIGVRIAPSKWVFILSVHLFFFFIIFAVIEDNETSK